MVYSGLWLEQLDPMERMQSNMWCWRKTALSLGNQPSSSIWGSTLQRGQDWDWYMQHWTVLWSVHDWHPPLSFRLLWHLVLLVVLWSCWKKCWVDIAAVYLKVQGSHGPLGQSVQWPVEEVTDPEHEDLSEFMAPHSSSVPVTCSPVVQHTLIHPSSVPAYLYLGCRGEIIEIFHDNNYYHKILMKIADCIVVLKLGFCSGN